MSVPERVWIEPEDNKYWHDDRDPITKIGLIPYRRETVCEWRSIDGWYRPSCDDSVGSAFKPGDYCPYCGGTIYRPTHWKPLQEDT